MEGGKRGSEGGREEQKKRKKKENRLWRYCGKLLVKLKVESDTMRKKVRGEKERKAK